MHGKSQFRDSISFTFTLCASTALMLLLAAVPAWAQNPVPPTARGAATLPKYTGKLHPATRPAAVNKPRTAAGQRTRQTSPQDKRDIRQRSGQRHHRCLDHQLRLHRQRHLRT